jgi:hypothetical protein
MCTKVCTIVNIKGQKSIFKVKKKFKDLPKGIKA